MDIHIAILTGFDKYKDQIRKTWEDDFKRRGYGLTALGRNGRHPRDVGRGVVNFVESMNKGDYAEPAPTVIKQAILTNDDHVMNALRVLFKRGAISKLEAVHFNDGGRHDIECEKWTDSGGSTQVEWKDYPDGFLDEWPRQTGELA